MVVFKETGCVGLRRSAPEAGVFVGSESSSPASPRASVKKVMARTRGEEEEEGRRQLGVSRLEEKSSPPVGLLGGLGSGLRRRSTVQRRRSWLLEVGGALPKPSPAARSGAVHDSSVSREGGNPSFLGGCRLPYVIG